jgi:hypothetical protein
MPDLNAVLSQTDKQKIVDWLTKKMTNASGCPVCGSKNWTIADHVVSPSLVNSVGVGLGSYPYPQAMVVSDCGYTFYMNLITSGVMKRE